MWSAVGVLKQRWNDSHWWKSKVLLWLIGNLCYRSNNGIYVMDEDWDNLIILDACRHDLFEEVLGKEVKFVISRGSATSEFVEENFVGHKYTDTVLVTANPYPNLLSRNSFYEMINVWDFGWNRKLFTVLPETVVLEAIKAKRAFPDKRLIIWFMQPHFPFIQDPDLFPIGFRYFRDGAMSGKHNVQTTPWIEVEKGNLNITDVWKAYRRNLEAVLPQALELARQLPGKSIITSDHGNSYERLWHLPITVAGHVNKIHIPSLVKVPWLEVE